MNLNIKKLLKWILLIVWLVVIFTLSNKPANISSEQSQFMLHLLNSMGIDLNSAVGNFAETLVRKSAHMFEYFVLFFLIYNVTGIECKKSKKAILIGVVGVFLYACTDEIHQLFVPGRAGRFTDVLVDTTGACIGAIILTLIKKLTKRVSYIRYD